MPIGFDRGDFGGAPPGLATVPIRPVWPRDRPDEPDEPDRWSWIDILRRLLTPILYTRWVTARDERVCPECGPLDGLVWETDAGPAPPLHVNCRCQRVFAYAEWRLRP
ncbi:MAG: phage minor head protein [Thermomicrobiales bacterium]